MKKLLFSLSFISTVFIVSAQVQGPNNPSAATETAFACLSCPGSDWNNFVNVYTNDNMNVSTSLSAHPNCFQSACFYSRYLEVSGYGFTIPLTASITGIIVEIKKSGAGIGTASFPIRDSVVSLTTGVGTIVGQNKSLSAAWPAVSTYSTYGGSTDLWGTTWTPAQIDSSGFGVSLMVRNISNATQTANVDHIRITVYYTLSIGINEMQSKTSDITVFPNPSSTNVNIISSNEPIESIILYDILGNKIIEKQNGTTNMKQEIDVKGIEKGIYFVHVKTKNGNKITKFVRE